MRHRALVRAARAWETGHPHQAWEILAACGFTESEWLVFRDAALTRARARFTRRLHTL